MHCFNKFNHWCSRVRCFCCLCWPVIFTKWLESSAIPIHLAFVIPALVETVHCHKHSRGIAEVVIENQKPKTTSTVIRRQQDAPNFLGYFEQCCSFEWGFFFLILRTFAKTIRDISSFNTLKYIVAWKRWFISIALQSKHEGKVKKVNLVNYLGR